MILKLNLPLWETWSGFCYFITNYVELKGYIDILSKYIFKIKEKGYNMSVLYFAKVRAASQIKEIYENPEKITIIMKLLMKNIDNDICYQREDINEIDGEEITTYEATYAFKYIRKLNKAIYGSIVKKSYMYVNSDIDERTGKLYKEQIDYVELIDFYFDTTSEVISYYTTSRFGFKEFANAFRELINIAMENEEEDYKFDVSVIRKGLKIEEIKEQLRKLGRLKDLKITINPPNANEEELNEILKNGEKRLEEMKEANVTSTSVLFNTESSKGLNIEAEMIDREINKIEEITSKLSSEEAISKNTATVEAHDRSGRRYTTKNNKPITDTIEEADIDNPDRFIEICKDKIYSALSTFL
ncbi:MAG: hypothetical protein FH762_19460 [Firmicutes bacterium]|nr:hypothetical protein [Bacillota bacterium]